MVLIGVEEVERRRAEALPLSDTVRNDNVMRMKTMERMERIVENGVGPRPPRPPLAGEREEAAEEEKKKLRVELEAELRKWRDRSNLVGCVV